MRIEQPGRPDLKSESYICEGLGFLGIELDEAGNTENAAVISAEHEL